MNFVDSQTGCGDSRPAGRSERWASRFAKAHNIVGLRTGVGSPTKAFDRIYFFNFFNFFNFALGRSS